MSARLVVTAVIAVLIITLALLGIPADSLSAQEPPTPIPLTPFPTLSPDATLTAMAADYPRVDGSTSTLPLQTLIACKILGAPCVRFMSPLDQTYMIAPMLDNSQVVESILSIQHTGTHESYMNLITGTADFILVAREPSADELVAAAAAGVALDTRAVALDAFVFLVNAANPRDDFSLDEIRAIYSGAITSWTALGVDTPLSDDPANPIQPYIRDPNSGSQELMDALVMRGTPMIDAPDMLVSTMIGLINVVGQDTAGIGYSVFYYAVFIAPDELVALVAIDGVPPTSETIADGTYPLVTEVYAVVREDMPDDSAAVRLRDWLLTPAGQAVVAESGYVPITE